MAKQDGKTAVAGVIASAAADVAAQGAGEQLELMPPLRPTLTDSQQQRAEASVKRDRAGRPPGAKNLATREMLEFVRKLCGDPLERRFRYAMHTPESLAIELGCTKLEAFDRLERMWADLSRFFYGQMAPTDSAGNAVAPRFTMVLSGQYAATPGAAAPGRKPWEYLEAANVDPQENQQLKSVEDLRSHGEWSHGEEN